MFKEYIPYVGERTTRRKVKDIFRTLDNKISFQFFIVMFITEGVKSFVAGNPMVATRMFLGSVIMFITLVIYLELGNEIKEKAKETKENVKDKVEGD